MANGVSGRLPSCDRQFWPTFFDSGCADWIDLFGPCWTVEIKWLVLNLSEISSNRPVFTIKSLTIMSFNIQCESREVDIESETDTPSTPGFPIHLTELSHTLSDVAHDILLLIDLTIRIIIHQVLERSPWDKPRMYTKLAFFGTSYEHLCGFRSSDSVFTFCK